MNQALVLSDTWRDEAMLFLARLGVTQSCFFACPIPEILFFEAENFRRELYHHLMRSKADSAMVVLPKSWATVEKMKDWPVAVYREEERSIVCAVIFADTWRQVEEVLRKFLNEKDQALPNSHLTCQYQPPYTNSLKLWMDAGGEEFHPGDFYHSEILSAISQMTGNWVYWGHGEGRRLRGYGHIETSDLLEYLPKSPLNATLWFTCSTLDETIPDNIALSWYLSGATTCLFASPKKVKTEENQRLSEAWLRIAKADQTATIASILLALSEDPSFKNKDVLGDYFLLGNPWVKAAV